MIQWMGAAPEWDSAGNSFPSHDLTASQAQKNPGKVIYSLKVSL